MNKNNLKAQEGIIRGVDDLGRIVIPKELRVSLDICIGSYVSIQSVEGGILVTPVTVENSCNICGLKENEENTMQTFRERKICDKCLEQISKLHTK